MTGCSVRLTIRNRWASRAQPNLRATKELGRDTAWQAQEVLTFTELAQGYLV